MVIHGGFWKAAYDLSLGRPLAASLAEHGWAAWNIEYRRVGNGGGDPRDASTTSPPRSTRCATRTSRSTGCSPSATPRADTSRPGRPRAAASRGGRPGSTLTGVVSQAGVLDLESAYADDLGAGAVVEASSATDPDPTTRRSTRSGRSRSTYPCTASTAPTTTTSR